MKIIPSENSTTKFRTGDLAHQLSLVESKSVGDALPVANPTESRREKNTILTGEWHDWPRTAAESDMKQSPSTAISYSVPPFSGFADWPRSQLH